MRATQAFLKVKLIIRSLVVKKETVQCSKIFDNTGLIDMTLKLSTINVLPKRALPSGNYISVASTKTSWNVAIRHHKVKNLTHN